MPITVVQIIRTEWTKASRGGEGARRRSAVPEALALPDQLIVGREAPYRLHMIHFAEGPWLGLHSAEVKVWAARGTIDWSERWLEGQAQTTGLDPDARTSLRRLTKARQRLAGTQSFGEGRWLRRLEKKFRAIQLLGDFEPVGGWEASNDPACLQRSDVKLAAAEEGVVASLGSRVLFTVRTGEWGRVRYNRRYSFMRDGWNYEGGWRYARTVVNIGLFGELRADRFTGTAPTYEVSRMADLR
jgi:hypothetical protein